MVGRHLLADIETGWLMAECHKHKGFEDIHPARSECTVMEEAEFLHQILAATEV